MLKISVIKPAITAAIKIHGSSYQLSDSNSEDLRNTLPR